MSHVSPQDSAGKAVSSAEARQLSLVGGCLRRQGVDVLAQVGADVQCTADGAGVHRRQHRERGTEGIPHQKPRDPRRALLWEHGFRKRDEVPEAPTYEEFEEQYCFLYDDKGNWTGGYAPHFVHRSEHLFLGYVREAVRYQGFQRAWWMSPDCTLEEVQEAVKGLGGLRRDYAEEGTGY